MEIVDKTRVIESDDWVDAKKLGQGQRKNTIFGTRRRGEQYVC